MFLKSVAVFCSCLCIRSFSVCSVRIVPKKTVTTSDEHMRQQQCSNGILEQLSARLVSLNQIADSVLCSQMCSCQLLTKTDNRKWISDALQTKICFNSIGSFRKTTHLTKSTQRTALVNIYGADYYEETSNRSVKFVLRIVITRGFASQSIDFKIYLAENLCR